jgi:hypothetical protein
MFFTRVQAIKDGKVKISNFRTLNNLDNAPEKMLQASRNFTNLFEVPTLFYVVAVFTVITFQVNYFTLALAWLYVIFRIFHSLVHLTSNNVKTRMFFYTLSWLALFIHATYLAYVIVSA